MERARETCRSSYLIPFSWNALPDFAAVDQHNTFGNLTEFERLSGFSRSRHPDNQCVSFLCSVHLQQFLDDISVSRLRIGWHEAQCPLCEPTGLPCCPTLYSAGTPTLLLDRVGLWILRSWEINCWDSCSICQDLPTGASFSEHLELLPEILIYSKGGAPPDGLLHYWILRA